MEEKSDPQERTLDISERTQVEDSDKVRALCALCAGAAIFLVGFWAIELGLNLCNISFLKGGSSATEVSFLHYVVTI